MNTGIEIFVAPLIGLLGVVVGGWLTNSHWKKNWSSWEKNAVANELLKEKLSKIAFLASQYIRGEFDGYHSIAGYGLHATDEEITKEGRDLHLNGYKYRINLAKYQKAIFEDFLKNSQNTYNDAKMNWDQLNPNNTFEEDWHTETTIKQLGINADSALTQLEDGYLKFIVQTSWIRRHLLN